MTDKRRRARVQGGWASQSVKTEKLKVEQCKPSNEFQFQPNIQIKKKPVDIAIRNSGKYDISSTAKGTSCVKLYHDFIPQDECDWMFEQLLNEIPWQQESIKIKGEKRLQPRCTAWYGDIKYTYSGLTLNPCQFSPTLSLLKERVEEKTTLCFNSMLANLYRNEKDSVDWHSDDEISLKENPTIASLSFGASRTFELRQEPFEGDDYSHTQRITIPLRNGTLLLMEGSTQQDWQHRVPKEYHDRDARINLTFRQIYQL